MYVLCKRIKTKKTPKYCNSFKGQIPTILNPENKLLQSFQNPQKSPLGKLWRSKKKYILVHQLHPDKEDWAFESVS